MLTDEERMQIWDGFVQSGDTENIANNYAIAIERAVLAKSGEQNLDATGRSFQDYAIEQSTTNCQRKRYRKDGSQ